MPPKCPVGSYFRLDGNSVEHGGYCFIALFGFHSPSSCINIRTFSHAVIRQIPLLSAAIQERENHFVYRHPRGSDIATY